MNTSEKIAAAIKGILDDDRRADRERIAELERDLAALRCAREDADSALEEHNLAQARLITTLNKQLDELNEKCAALVVERNSLTVENNHLHAENKRLVETPAVKQEEQGPWVVARQSAGSVTGWNYYNDPKEPEWAMRANSATRFELANIAEAVAVQTNDRFGSGWFVRTLAEARAIEAKR